MMNRQQHSHSATRERVGLAGSVFVAALLFVGGVYLARRRADPHWVNRAGAAIVAVQAVAATIDFARRSRLQEVARESQSNIGSRLIEDGQRRPHGRDELAKERVTRFVETEIAKSERQAFAILVLLAAIGEILHGFGDLLLRVVIQ